MAEATVRPRHGAEQVAALLDLPEVRRLIRDLDATRWTGRKGYPVRVMVGVALAKSVYAVPTWTRTLRLLGVHKRLRKVVGGVPSDDAVYRFTRKMREHGDALDRTLDRIVAGLRAANPDYGVDVAVDGSDMLAYVNGQRYLYNGGPERARYADPDASWGHRSSVGTRKGRRLLRVQVARRRVRPHRTPVAWTVRTARDAEKNEVPVLLDIAARRGIHPATAALDKGYDAEGVYAALTARRIRPVIALVRIPRVERGEHLPPTCAHGVWTFAGADDTRWATTWRCPTAECAPRSVRLPYSRLHPPIPHGSEWWKRLYKGRLAVERAFGRMKNDHGLAPLRVRCIGRVALHADLTMLTILGAALVKARLPAVA